MNSQHRHLASPTALSVGLIAGAALGATSAAAFSPLERREVNALFEMSHAIADYDQAFQDPQPSRNAEITALSDIASELDAAVDRLIVIMAAAGNALKGVCPNNPAHLKAVLAEGLMDYFGVTAEGARVFNAALTLAGQK